MLQLSLGPPPLLNWITLMWKVSLLLNMQNCSCLLIGSLSYWVIGKQTIMNLWATKNEAPLVFYCKWAHVELLWCLSLPWVTLYNIPLTKCFWPSVRDHREVCENCLLWGSCYQSVSSLCVGLQYSSSWSTLSCCLQRQ